MVLLPKGGNGADVAREALRLEETRRLSWTVWECRSLRMQERSSRRLMLRFRRWEHALAYFRLCCDGRVLSFSLVPLTFCALPVRFSIIRWQIQNDIFTHTLPLYFYCAGTLLENNIGLSGWDLVRRRVQVGCFRMGMSEGMVRRFHWDHWTCKEVFKNL